MLKMSTVHLGDSKISGLIAEGFIFDSGASLIYTPNEDLKLIVSTLTSGGLVCDNNNVNNNNPYQLYYCNCNSNIDANLPTLNMTMGANSNYYTFSINSKYYMKYDTTLKRC